MHCWLQVDQSSHVRDDLVVVTPTASGLRTWLQVNSEYAESPEINCNSHKSVYMVGNKLILINATLLLLKDKNLHFVNNLGKLYNMIL